jgi:hypothetical protein
LEPSPFHYNSPSHMNLPLFPVLATLVLWLINSNHFYLVARALCIAFPSVLYSGEWQTSSHAYAHKDSGTALSSGFFLWLTSCGPLYSHIPRKYFLLRLDL